ncbi:MAG: (4Fe-4S)-binding protein [Cyclobacteriaceae bacterium]|nr:(4Fe-4S)-binding protein [Cyclobacteriaceae bacterium]
MKDIVKKYSNGEVTIVWKPSLCIHSRNCFTGLGEVFHPQELPWITPQRSTTDKIIDQIKKCPSGALSYVMNNEVPSAEEPTGQSTLVEPSPNGPLMVHGTLAIKKPDGTITRKEKVTAFCRCGGSANKPFCDGTHRKIGFQD